VTAVAGLLGDRTMAPVGAEVWEDTRIKLPEVNDRTHPWPSTFREVFTDETVVALENGGSTWLEVAQILSRFPVAILTPAA
jgi:hypothetical protein